LYKRIRRHPDGREYTRWIAQVSHGQGDERHVVRRVHRTKAEAKAALDELLGPPRSGRLLGDYLRSWLDETAGPSLAPNTVKGYAAAIASLDAIADIPLRDLAAEDVEAAINRLVSRPVGRPTSAASPKTRRNALAMLRRALDSAVRRGHLARNVALLVDMPRVPRRSRAAMTPERARAVLVATEGDRYEAAYALALCGLRAGEILGLAWEDVDLDAGVAHVRYQLVGSGRKAARAQLKTRASEAPVPLPTFAMSRLREHRRKQLEERVAAGQSTEDGLVFVTPRGWPVDATWLTKHLRGLAGVGLHDCRHGAASLLVAAGTHPRVAQALLRHTTSRITLDVYSASTRAQEREAADALDRLLA
jgi:integrase